MTENALQDAIGQLVPECSHSSGDWEDVLLRAAIAGRPSQTSNLDVDSPRRNRLRWTRRRLAVAGIAAGVVVLVATPGFGVGGLLLDLIGRTNVPFARGKPAPLEVKRDFFDLSLFAPRGMGPDAIASQTRRVGTFQIAGRTRNLYVAPTREGGYCWQFAKVFGGCRVTRTLPQRPSRAYRGSVKPWLLGLTWQGTPIRVSPQGALLDQKPPYATQVGGDILTKDAHTLQIEYEDGSTTPIRFIFVSKPIAAGFFLRAIPDGHTESGTRAKAVAALDVEGRVLSRQPITYTMPRPSPRPPRSTPPPPVRVSRVPEPAHPLQYGEVDGITVVAGQNGVAVFDTSGAAKDVRELIGRKAGFACFSYMRFHQDSPAHLGNWRPSRPRVAIQASGLRTPFDGCEIQGGYGHTWPDRNKSHSAVEIPFTSRGRRYFADRAAARDLALFVRSDEMHRIRKLTGAALRSAMTERYGAAITRLPTIAARHAVNRIGYVLHPGGITLVERSISGRRFFVVVERGKITRQNVKPLGFVY